jgi:hypothetical protein
MAPCKKIIFSRRIAFSIYICSFYKQTFLSQGSLKTMPFTCLFNAIWVGAMMPLECGVLDFNRHPLFYFLKHGFNEEVEVPIF